MSLESKKRLKALRTIVEDLSDRDVRIKQDLQLFGDFFKNFPLPVTMWSVSKEGNVISQRGNGLICGASTSLEDLFLCPVVKGMCLEAHELALKGESVQQFVTQEKNIFYVSIVPRRLDNKEIVGVAGIAWDITSNAVILSILEDIQKLSEEKQVDTKKIRRLATKGLKSSRLKMLIQEKD